MNEYSDGEYTLMMEGHSAVQRKLHQQLSEEHAVSLDLSTRRNSSKARSSSMSCRSTEMDSLIPASKICNLTQGVFVGAVSDNLTETIEANYKRVKQEVINLVNKELERIKDDPDLTQIIKG